MYFCAAPSILATGVESVISLKDVQPISWNIPGRLVYQWNIALVFLKQPVRNRIGNDYDCWSIQWSPIVFPKKKNVGFIIFIIINIIIIDLLCGLVVRVLGYRSGGPGSIPGTTRKKVVGPERGPQSLVSTTEELFDRKVAAPV
jgi:hypothetical protein